MKKIIIGLLSIFVFTCFSSVYSEASAFSLTTDNVEVVVGEEYSGTISVLLASSDSLDGYQNQDNTKYVTDLNDLSPFDIDKTVIDAEAVKTFFTDKPLPMGLEVTSIEVGNPTQIEDYSNTLLKINVAGTIDSSFVATDYDGGENSYIKISIPKEFLTNYNLDTPLTLNTTFSTGKYIVKYVVKFDLQGHGSAIDDQKLVINSKVTKPNDPSESGYEFGGWYKESTCTNAYDFENEVVSSNMTLYAKWTEEYVEPYVEPDDDPIEVPVYIPVKTCIE